MVAQRTTVNIEEGLMNKVRDSGVRNISKHIEKLLRNDLKEIEKVGAREKKRVEHMLEELDKVEVRWLQYLKRKGEA